MFVVGIALLGISIYLFFKKYKFVSSAEKTVGTIVEVVSHISETQDEDGYTTRTKMYTPIIEFTDLGGNVHKFKATISNNSKRKFKVGKNMNVLYSKDNPDKVEVNKFFSLWGLPILFLIIAIAIFIGGAAA